MTDLSKLHAEHDAIKELLAKATPGPWTVVETADREHMAWISAGEKRGSQSVALIGHVDADDANDTAAAIASLHELARIADAYRERIGELENALRPFTHPDLCQALGGNTEGDASPVFQRQTAMLRLGDFRRAAGLLSDGKDRP